MDTQNSFSASARRLVRRAIDQLHYPCCFNDFVEDLERQQDTLIKTRHDIEECLKNSKTQVLDLPVVHAWSEREANPLKGNVEELLKEARRRINKSYCFVRCPNWIWRCRMAKKLTKKKVEVENCIKEGDMYIKLEDVVSSTDAQNLPLEKPLSFDSRKDAYKKLLEALKNDNITMVGLYGMGGCGKTTMALELKKIAEAENLFNEVHFVTVSNNRKLEVRSIQDKIAKAVQIPSLRGGESERAQDLRTRLSLEHKRILMILDDVWKELDFGAIGIPIGENHKNCKVLITTRSEGICTSMNCKTNISLSILTDGEAWDLFQKKAHISEGTSDALRHLGKLISDECKGLPVAIAALAGTLKGKIEKDWQDALDNLKSSIPVNINEADYINPYRCLRVSYDNLDTEKAKSLLLLCSVFPEDSEIPVELLTRFVIGMGLVGEVRSFEEARDKVCAVTNKLISSSLLSLVYDDRDIERVKMHDLVRDVAIWIASEENKAVKCLLEKDMTLECSSTRYLWCMKFPNELDCSSVEFISISTDLEVSDKIFQVFIKGMERLRVLILTWEGGGRGSLPTMSLRSLTNLRCLFLYSWELGDISSVGQMTNLESLILHDCSFNELSDVVVTQLKNLRLLHLTKCRMKRNPLEVIGRNPRLEELYFYDEGSNKDFGISEHEEFSKMFIVPQALRRYGIMLGSKFEDHEEVFFNGHISLCLSCFDTSNATLKELAKKAEVLYVANIKGGGKNIIPDIFQIEGGKDTSYKWIELRLCDSEGIECLVDTSNHFPEVGILLSGLRKLRIESTKHLEALYRGVPPSGLFEKLEQLYIKDCPMLTCLFTPEVARNLVRLEKLVISSCDGLKYLLADDETEDKEIRRHDHGLVFSKLKKINIDNCEMMEYIIPVTFARGLVQLKSLKIDECPELKYVFGQCTHGDQIQNELRIEFPALEKLRLIDNSKMTSISPSYCFITWPLLLEFRLIHCPNFDILSINTFKASSLKISRFQDTSTIEKHFLTSKSLVIDNNSKIESIFNLDGVENIGKPVNLQLQSLDLRDVDDMKYICMGVKDSFTFQNLKTLQIHKCNKLEVVFSASVLRFLPELQVLDISDCKELKQVIEEDFVENQNLSDLVSSQPCFPKLVALFIADCYNLKRLLGVSASNVLPNLELLFIKGVEKLEDLIGCEQGQANDIGKVKVELPTLILLVLLDLSNLCQGIEYPTPTTRVVHGCPKLPLHSSNATFEEFEVKMRPYRDRVPLDSWGKMRNIIYEAIELHQVFTPRDFGVESPEWSIVQKPPGEIETTIEISQSIEGLDPTSMQQALPNFGSELAPPLNKLPWSLVDQESTTEPSLPDQRYELGETILINSTKEKIKEGIQEDSTLEDSMKETVSAGTDDNCLPVVALTCTETGTSQNQKMQSNDVSNGSIEVHQDTSSSLSSIVAELGAFKDSADLNDAQIALLGEEIVVYPHLLKGLDKFSTRFQVLMLKTLADILFFLRNESSTSVNLQRENEFLKLCDEAVQLGFDKSWVDDMRKRVMSMMRGKERAKSHNAEMVTMATHSDLQSDPLVTSHCKPYQSHSIEETKTTSIEEVPTSVEPTVPTSGLELAILHKMPLRSIENKINESVQEGSTWEDTPETSRSADTKGNDLGFVVVTQPETGTLQRQKMQNVDDSLLEGSNLMVSRVENPDKSVIQKTLGETRSAIEIPQSINRDIEEGATSNNDTTVTSSTLSDPTSSQQGSLATFQRKSYPLTENKLSQAEKNTDKESKGHPINIKDFEDGYPISLFQPVLEEDCDCQTATYSTSVVPEDHTDTKDNLVAKVVAELEECLKMPMKDIVSSEAKSLRLLTALRFLSCLPSEDVTLSGGLKSIIDSLHREFPSILCSFQQVFAVKYKSAVLEEKERSIEEELTHRNELVIKAKEEEEMLMEQITGLEKEIKECEVELSSLQEEKKKCIVETIGLKKELENVRREKSQMMEDQRKAQQQLLEVNYKWSALCCQFELNRIAARNIPF